MNYDNSALHLSPTDAEKFVDIMINPPVLSENLKKLLLKKQNVYENAGTYKVRTRQEWSDLLKELNIDWC